MIKKMFLGAGLVLLTAVASQAMAADSEFGSTSTDSINVKATVAPVVRIVNLPTDVPLFDLGASFLNGSSVNKAQTVTFCVYSNVDSAGTYSLSAASDGGPLAGPKSGSNGWALKGSTAGSALSFTIKVSDAASMNAASARVLGAGDQFQFHTNTFNGNRENTGSCTGGNNTQLQINFNQQDVLAANADSYSGVVTLTAHAL